MIGVIIIPICALQSEPIYSYVKILVFTGLSFCLTVHSNDWLPNIQVVLHTCTFPYFLSVYIRHVGVFTSQFLTLPRLSFKLQNSPGGGLELGYWKGLSFLSIHSCWMIVYLSQGFHIQKIHVRLRLSLAKERPSGPGNLGKDWTGLSSEDPAGSADHFVCRDHLSLMLGVNSWCL